MKLTQKILVLALVLVASIAVSAQTVEEIATKAMDAMGGKAKMESIETMFMRMSGTMQGSMSVSMDMTIKKPDSFHMDMNMMGQNMTMVKNGDDMWMEMMGQTMDVPASQGAGQEQMTAGFGDLVLQLQKMNATYKGTEDFGGATCHAIEYTDPNSGEKGVMYFNTATNLMAGVKNNTGQGEVEMHIKSYQDIDGMKMPATMVVMMNGSEMMNMEISDVKINPAVDDAMFQR